MAKLDQFHAVHIGRGRFRTCLNEFHAPLFPRFTIDYLHDLTIGIYQINLSSGYIQDKLQRDQSWFFL